MMTFARTSSPRQILALVSQFSAARRRAEALRLGVRGIAAGGALAFVVGVAVDYWGLDGGPALAVGFVVVAALVGAAIGWTRRVPELRIALEIDRCLELGERVTTALELARSGADLAWSGRQIDDALGHLATVRPRAVYPFQVSRRGLAFAAVGIALAALPLAFAGRPLVGIPTPASRVAATTRAQATQLDQAANLLAEQKTPSDSQTRAALAAQLHQAAAQLRQDGGNSQDAAQDLQTADQAAAALAPPTGEPAAQTLARIADALNGQAMTQSVTQALDQENTAQAAAALKQLAAQSASMTPAQRQDLAKALQAASDAARNSDTNAAQQLAAAAQAAKNGDAQQAQQAATALQQLGAASQAQSDVTQARSALDASQQAISQAAQSTGQAALSQSGPNAQSSSQSPGLSPSLLPNPASGPSENGQSGAQSLGESGSQAGSSQGQSPGNQTAGNQSGGQNGGGIGNGTTNHLGTPTDPRNLAQREVTVPTNQQGQPGAVSPSDQLQAGTPGEAHVDYRSVLPSYQKQALQAISGNAVPAGLKQAVKGYFDALAAH